MAERFDVIDCDARKAWSLKDEGVAIRYAAARHAATGNVVEVVRNGPAGAARVFVVPPNAPLARS